MLLWFITKQLNQFQRSLMRQFDVFIYQMIDEWLKLTAHTIESTQNYWFGNRSRLLVWAPDSISKGCEFEFRQERWEKFLLQSQLCVLTLIRCPFHLLVTALARKRPRSFCQKCKWRVTPEHASTFDSTKSGTADYAAVGHNAGIYPETSSHATCQRTFCHSRISSMSLCGLVLA